MGSKSVCAATVALLFVSLLALSDDAAAKKVTLDAGTVFQTMDGFGVNVTPAQWRKGNLKPALDLLVDDLGSTLIRFDCWGKADWLDPARRGAQGTYPEPYLAEVYSRQEFKDAWECFRYLNSKGIEPFFNVSGRIPKLLAGPDGQTLTDHEGYAEMVVSMLRWAREREKLRFRLFAPFNETDLGFPEGPKIPPGAAAKTIDAITERMDKAGLGDVKLIVMDDSGDVLGFLDSLLKVPALAPRIASFATHNYGNGGDEDGLSWFLAKSRFAQAAGRIAQSEFRKCPLWVTEYGDLDQSGEVEFGVAWRSTRRLLNMIRDGVSAALVWDAFDNYHEHDAAWATYGLLQTDRSSWKYAPKRRYFAARQVFRFVPPGFRRVEIAAAAAPDDVYHTWRSPLKHMLLAAFAAPDLRDFTVVGMSTIERQVPLEIRLVGLAPGASAKRISCYRTSRNEDCRLIGDVPVQAGVVRVEVPENSIFTLTTVDPLSRHSGR